MSEKYPWRDEELLRKLHEERGLSQYEIADKFDCDRATITKWCDRYDIERPDPPWRDKETLEELYLGEGLTVHEIGDKFDCDGTTISNWLDRHDIEVDPMRGLKEAQKTNRLEPAGRYMARNGYMMWRSGDCYFGVHRLLAIAKYGPEAVKDMEVHHKNGVKWDNRSENIELVSKEEHAKMHYSEREINDKGQFV